MRNYPRNQKSRDDALKGSGHIGNHSPRNPKSAKDTLLRHEPGRDTDTTVRKEYGGNL